MRKKSLSTLLAWAFAAPESAQNTEPNGWDVQGSAGPKTGASSAGAMSVSVDQEGGTIQDGSTNKGRSTNAVTERGQGAPVKLAERELAERGQTPRTEPVPVPPPVLTNKRGSKNGKGSASPKPADEAPVALCCLTEIVDQPLEWVVDGVIPRGELTLITGEAGVGKSSFLAGLIAKVTRGWFGPRDALRPEDAGHADDLPPSEEEDDTDCDTDFDFDFDLGFDFDDDDDDEDDDEDDEEEDEDDDEENLLNPRRNSAGGTAVQGGEMGANDSIGCCSSSPAGRTSCNSGRDVGATIGHTPAAVVIFSTPNMLADAVRPQLIEAGADLGNVYALCQLEADPLEAEQRQVAARADGGRDRKTVETGGSGRGQPDQAEGDAGHNVGAGKNVGSGKNVGAGRNAADADSATGTSCMRPRMFQWQRDLPVLEAELSRLRACRVEVSMIVIDSIDGFVDSPRRRSLLAADVEKLAELARKFRVAIVLAANVSPAAMLKSNRPRGMAGIDALSTVARTVWMIVRDLDVANGRMLIPIKKNRSMNSHGFAYCLSQGKIAWDDEPVGIQGEDFIREATLTPQASLAREHQFENDRAANWLHQRLCGGKTPAFEVQAAAAEHEIGDALLRRAFRSLGCKTQKEKEPGGKARWYWRLPGEGFLTRRAGPRFVAQPCP